MVTPDVQAAASSALSNSKPAMLNSHLLRSPPPAVRGFSVMITDTAPAGPSLTSFAPTAQAGPRPPPLHSMMGELKALTSTASHSLGLRPPVRAVVTPQQLRGGRLDARHGIFPPSVAVAAYSSVAAKGSAAVQAQPLDLNPRAPSSAPLHHNKQAPSVDAGEQVGTVSQSSAVCNSLSTR